MENTLNIQLTVTDGQMTSLLNGKLESLPDEKIQEIFANALMEFFKTPTGQRMFYDEGYYGSKKTPSQLLEKMVSNAVSKDLLRPVVDELIATFKDKYPELLRAAMVNTFTNLFFDNLRQADISMAIARIDTKQDKE